MSQSTLMPSYLKTLNPIQRQIFSEVGIDYLWGETLAVNLQRAVEGVEDSKSVSDSASLIGVDTQAIDTSTQQIATVVSEPVTPASQQEIQDHAQKALKILQRARHRLPETPVAATSSTPVSQETEVVEPVPVAQPTQILQPQQTQQPPQEQERQTVHQGQKSLSQMSWQELRDYAESCIACELKDQRQGTVFANHNEERQSDWLFLEQVPSESDEISGEPMSSEAGVLFDQMLFALGLARSEVAVLPLIKCRPDLSMGFNKDWLSACSPILLEQIKRIKPKCIVAFGDAAAVLLQEDKGLLALRRQELFFEHAELGKIPVIATFSPHFLLLNSAAKAQSWQDLKRARQLVRGHA